MDKRIAELLNSQVNKEFYSAYLYLDFSDFYFEKGLFGYANWYRVQAKEELDHALKMVQYLGENAQHVSLDAIAKPNTTLEEYNDPLKSGLAHEKYITASIGEIYAAAEGAKDYRTQEFLSWFIKEQAEEELDAGNQLRKFEMFGGDAKGLYLLDKEMAERK